MLFCSCGNADEVAPEVKGDASKISAENGDSPLPNAPEYKADTLLAEVCGQKLTYGEAVEAFKTIILAQGAPTNELDRIVEANLPRALPQITERFIISELLKAEAANRKIAASDDDVEKYLAELVKTLPPGASFEEIVKRSGKATEEEFRAEVKKSLPIKMLFDDIVKDVTVSTNDVEKFYNENAQFFEKPEEVRASHILFTFDDAAKTNDAAKAVIKAKADEVRKEILAGGDFAELAKKHSGCPSSQQGGDLGFFSKGRMVPPFEKAAFEAKTGDVTEIVETQFGYHIIKVTDRHEASKEPLSEVYKQIEDYLGGSKKSEIAEKFVEDIRKNGKYTVHESIEVFPELPEEVLPIPADAE